MRPPVSAGASTRFHFMPAPFSGSTLWQKRQAGGGGRGSALRISSAASLPASIAKSQCMQQMSPWNREAGVTRVSAPHMLHSAYQLPKTRMARPRMGTRTRGTSPQLVASWPCSKHDLRSRRNLATSDDESRSAAALVEAAAPGPPLRLPVLHMVDTMVAGLRSAGRSGLDTGSSRSSSSASAAVSSATAVRSAADERLAQRMCPSHRSPSMASMLADRPTSLNGWSLPVLSCTELTTRRHSEQQ